MLANGDKFDAFADGGSANARSPEGWMQIRGLTKSFAGELALHGESHEEFLSHQA